jgi:hypothetical protein
MNQEFQDLKYSQMTNSQLEQATAELKRRQDERRNFAGTLEALVDSPAMFDWLIDAAKLERQRRDALRELLAGWAAAGCPSDNLPFSKFEVHLVTSGR